MNAKFPYKYHGASSFAQPLVLQSVLLILVFSLASLYLRFLLRGTWGRGISRHRGPGARAGGSALRRRWRRAEESLGCEGLLPLLIGLQGGRERQEGVQSMWRWWLCCFLLGGMWTINTGSHIKCYNDKQITKYAWIVETLDETLKCLQRHQCHNLIHLEVGK